MEPGKQNRTERGKHSKRGLTQRVLSCRGRCRRVTRLRPARLQLLLKLLLLRRRLSLQKQLLPPSWEEPLLLTSFCLVTQWT